MKSETESGPIRLVVCDDHLLVREGLKAVMSADPDIEVIGESASAEEAIRLVDQSLPDVVIMDVVLPGMDGIEATRFIKQTHPSVAVIVLTRYEDTDHIMEIYRAGAAAYLTKGVERDELLATVHAVSSGNIVLHARVAGEVIRTFADATAAFQKVAGGTALAPTGLSPREMEVLRLIGQGKSNKEIARELTISLRTAQNHVANIFRKLELNDRISAALFALQGGIGKPAEPGRDQPVVSLPQSRPIRRQPPG